VTRLSPTRRTIAARLVKSNLEAPQAWTMVEADVTGLVRRREAERERFERAGVHLTLFHYFVEAVCKALRDVPALNARWEGDDLVRYDRINLGIAVAAESGLVVPVLKDAGSLSLEGIARAVNDLADRARARRLKVEDIEGGTFTVNNTGAFGSIASKPIVNHPEVGIVTFERAVQRPVVRDEAIAIRWMANCCLSFDHRALDGLEAGRFLETLKAALEAA
jgi:2-oxoisovalerate dehydrogenase E2 component (dihydrolipoyl transacylase)